MFDETSLKSITSLLALITAALGIYAGIEKMKIKDLQKTLDNIREKLKQVPMSVDIYYPVILVGPRQVGKSSLLREWHAAWKEFSRHVGPSIALDKANVPVLDFLKAKEQPHFVDSAVKADLHLHLGLSVFDFPGELSHQTAILEQLKEECVEIKKKTNNADLGVSLVCMLDAAEASNGISQQTTDYYTADLFRSIKHYVETSDIKIDNIVIVFNKLDLLQAKNPGISEDKLFKLCEQKFSAMLSPIRNVCSSQRIEAIFTTLDRGNIKANRGSAYVRALVARKFVDTVAGTAQGAVLVNYTLRVPSFTINKS